MKPLLQSLPQKSQKFIPLQALVETMNVKEANHAAVRQDIIGLIRHFPPLPTNYDPPKLLYIDKFFNLVNLFCEYYELEQCFFDVLEQAMEQLEKAATSPCQQQSLPEYFEKTAMIFQIASNKTEMKDRQLVFIEKAKHYIQKASEARSQFLPSTQIIVASDDERLFQLFHMAVKTYCKEVSYAFPYFQLLSNQYEEKILSRLKAIENSISNSSFDLSEETIFFIESSARTTLSKPIKKEAHKILKLLNAPPPSHHRLGFLSLLFQQTLEITEPLLVQEQNTVDPKKIR